MTSDQISEVRNTALGDEAVGGRYRFNLHDLRLFAVGASILIATSIFFPNIPIAAATTLGATALAYRLSHRCYFILALTGALFGIGIGASVHSFLIDGTGAVDANLLHHVAEEAIKGGLIGLAVCIPYFFAAYRRQS
ncbi:MAG: hypothetical protein GY906_31515 [bacterium]|nr:hypothetical protein [bacterium]